MLESSERKQPVPILAAAQEPPGILLRALGRGRARGTVPAATAMLTKCRERTEKPWQ